MGKIQRILFIELLGGIGDVVIALPAIHALARSYSTAQLTVLTFAPGGELLEADPLIHRVLYVIQGKVRQTVEALLFRETFDLIVSDTNYDGIAELIDHTKKTERSIPQTVTNLWRSPPPDERVSDRFLSILQAEGLVADHALIDDAAQIYLTAKERATARQAFGASYRPIVFLCADAGMAIKQWSSTGFIAIGQALQQQYDATVIVPVGSDAVQAQQIVAAVGGTACLWQRGSLRSFAAAVSQADLMIAADTGPARIAAALDVPTVTLFGPSWSGRYGQPAPHLNLQGFPSCPERLIHNFTKQRCWYSGQCPFEWKTCLDDITPDQVLQAAATLLEKVEDSGKKVEEKGWRVKSEGKRQRIAGRKQEDRKQEDRKQRTEGITDSSCKPIPPAWRSVRNLLVMRLDNIGDVLMTSPALQALRDNLPEATITLMTSPAGALTAPLLPWVDQVLPWRVLWQDLGRLTFDPAREWELIETLNYRKFDAAIIFTSFSQSPHPAALICALAGIPLRLGESKELDRNTLTDAVPAAADEMHQVDRNLHLIESIGFHIRDRHLVLSVPNSVQLPSLSHSYILLNPWTSCQSRNYDSDRFAIAARRLSNITGLSVLVTGVEKDKQRSRSLLNTLGDCAVDLVGATSLTELVALVAGAKLVLTNNTSTMHIADAMGTPNVVLFAGTELESQWRPRHSPSRLLRRPTACSPCYTFTCPYTLQCLDISPDTVVEAGLALLMKNSLDSLMSYG